MDSSERPLVSAGESAEPGQLIGLHHVQLSAPRGSEAVLRRFYGTVLGMTEVPKPQVLAARGGAWFRSGSLELHLGIEDDFRPAGKAHPGILVTDIDAIAKRLREHNVAVQWDDNFPGFRRCYVADPHGNRLELLAPTTP
jgi:catechol 2,3-dioxygenase-like lactoylglutathione lyase family enzyme